MSTYSTNLGIELIGTGEQDGTWGTTTNTNLGTLIEQAISGYTTYACTGGTDTITIPNGASGTARNMFLELTGTGGGTLVVPQNKKLYFVYNNTSSGAVTIKVTGQTGVSVPNGAKVVLVSNGTDVVNATNYLASLTLGAALPVASGGTGQVTANAAFNALAPSQASANGKYLKSDGTNTSWDAIDISTADITGVLALVNGGTGSSTASGARTNLGLGSMATQNSTSVAITGGTISGITDLAIADGGTGASTAADARTNLGVTATGADTTYAYRANNLSDLASASSARTNLGLGSMATQNSTSVSITGGAISGITDIAVADGGTGSSTASGARSNLGAAASGANSDITSLSGLTTPLSVSQGGTSGSSFTANNVLLGNGTSSFQVVAPSTSGNVLTSNGTTWVSSAPAAYNLQYSLYTTGSGTWTCPTGVTKVKVIVIGGGGGGESGGGSGKLGGLATGIYTVTPSTGYSYAVGAGTNSNTSGSRGGTSSFGSFCSATGGSSNAGGAPGETNGVGTGGSFANTYVTDIGLFAGSSSRTGSTSAVAWSASLGVLPGALGGGDSGGVGGIVYIEYAG